MNDSQFKLASGDGREFHCYKWSNSEPRAIVQIVHGAAEHAGRYADFASALVDRGFAVFAEDHRGHGLTVASNEALGNMGPANALERVSGDVLRLTEHAGSEFPGVPLVLFGHSMGSLISQLVLTISGERYDAVVLSGSASSDIMVQAKPAIDEAVARQGRDAPAEELQMSMFSAFAEAFEVPRTPFDWLSRDPAEVDKYIEDPLCGFPLSNGAWQDMAEAAPRTTDPAQLRQIPAALPILIFSGADDPVHVGGTAIDQIHSGYRDAGLGRVDKHLYPGGRHEMLNELNKEEVFADVIGWIEKTLEDAG